MHAFGQVANFRCATALAAGVLLRGLNSLLPDDVVICSCESAPSDFHARYDARSKTYVYRILNRQLAAAVGRHYAWHIRAPLDLAAVARATEHIVGKRDFKAFEASGSPRSSTVRTVSQAAWKRRDHGCLEFSITADGFLRFMVRNLVGTLVDVGRGKLAPSDFEVIVHSLDRRRAGATAPPHGLFLLRVDY